MLQSKSFKFIIFFFTNLLPADCEWENQLVCNSKIKMDSLAKVYYSSKLEKALPTYWSKSSMN